MLLAVSAASVSAQTYQIRKDSVKTGEYSPTVYLVSVNAPQPPADEEALLEAAVLNQLAIDNAIRDYIEPIIPVSSRMNCLTSSSPPSRTNSPSRSAAR